MTDEQNALIAMAYEVAENAAKDIEANPVPTLWNFGTTPTNLDRSEWNGRRDAAQDIAILICSLTPNDARAALERVKEQARAEERERCARIAEDHDWLCKEADRVCVEIAAAIRSNRDE